MSTQTGDGREDDHSFPAPDVVVYAWLALLEALTAAGLVIFSIALLEGSELIPNVLEEISVGFGTLVVVALLSFYLKWR